MTQDNVISKIQKLLRLGQSENEHEAALAVAAAQKLMDKHNISNTMLVMGKGRGEEEEDIRNWEEPLWAARKNRSRWRITLAVYLAETNACRVYTSNRGDIQIIGRASDVQTVRYLFLYCENEIERLSKRYAGNGKGWINNYKIGACNAIHDKLKQAKTQARSELMVEYGSLIGAAIVKVDQRGEAVEQWMGRNLKLRTGASFGRQSYSKDARETGYKDGQNINLSSGKGLGGGIKGRLK